MEKDPTATEALQALEKRVEDDFSKTKLDEYPKISGSAGTFQENGVRMRRRRRKKKLPPIMIGFRGKGRKRKRPLPEDASTELLPVGEIKENAEEKLPELMQEQDQEEVCAGAMGIVDWCC